MVEDPLVAAQEYTLTLAELKGNNKTQINLLTILADDYKAAASHIVDAIEQHILTVPPKQKLAVMYVCDSILKNVKKPNEYGKLFARKIVTMFEHVFRQGDENVRIALYKLRITWATTESFMPSKLYQLDMKVNALDSAWPISNPRTGRALRDDPNVAPPALTSPSTPSSSSAGTSSGATSSGSSSGARGVFVNRKFIESTSTPARKTEKTKTPPGSASSSSGAATSSGASQRAIKREVKKEQLDPLDKLLPTPGHSSSSSKSANSSSASSSKRKAIPPDHSNAPNRKKPQGTSSSAPKPAPVDEDLRMIQRGPPQPQRHHTPQDQDFRGRSLKPTSVAGSHAFAAPVRPLMAPLPPGPPAYQPPQPHHHQQQLHHHNSPPQDPAPLMMHPGAGGGGHYQPPQQAYQAAAPPMMMNGPPTAQITQGGAGGGQPQKHVYETSETTKLDVPANNRIFVEGKAYEVMFVDDTAVIERGGAPHRIYFAGPPRNLLIDGVPHMLPFDTPTTLNIHGNEHVVKFGAPSRELYIGGHPFKGQFGGPPIIAFINKRRHEIRLTGSAPEVRIEPEPAYHLQRFLHKMREEKKIEITADKPKDTGDWLAYLKNLQKTGVLPAINKSTSSPRGTPPPMGGPASSGGQMQQQHNQRNRNQPNMRGMRPGSGGQWNGKATMMMDTPPPPPPSASGSSGNVEKRNTCPSNLKDFNIRVLQIRYTSLVERLVTKRADACKFCGMRLDDSNGKSKEWQDHMDWHVKQNLSRGTQSDQANVRPWYPLAANWLTARASDQPCKEEPRDEPLPGVASSGVNAKECAVCQEKFDEYFDDDEETWRLRDTVVVHGKIVHARCTDDAQLMDVTPSTSYQENPFIFSADDVKQEIPDDEEQDVKHDVKSIISSVLSGR